MYQLKYLLVILGLLMISGCANTGIDLVVNRVDWDSTRKNAEVEISNIGSSDAGPFMVYVNADEIPESQNHRPQIRHHVTGLSSSTFLVLQADFAPLAHSDNNYLGNVYQITALADPKSMVNESNEENNFFRTPVVVPSVELYDKNDNLVPANPSPLPDGGEKLPILFVHGHNLLQLMDQDLNYQKNWQDMLDYPLFGVKLTSFKKTLIQPENEVCNIEPYYIRFVDQNRSITADASEIGEAVNRILKKHNDPDALQVKVVIIAYSKGTISTRWYLKNMMPLNRPVSEFIAIAPPNHGLALNDSSTISSVALRQLNNGFREDCTSFGEGSSHNFIERLNGHAIQDTEFESQQRIRYRGEAPASRSGVAPAGDGILYLTLYATGNKDDVGGHTPSNDCQGRILAKNLAPDAMNLPVSQITELPPPDLVEPSWLVHAKTVHTPDVICLALYTAVYHQFPPSNLECRTKNVDDREVPIIP